MDKGQTVMRNEGKGERERERERKKYMRLFAFYFPLCGVDRLNSVMA